MNDHHDQFLRDLDAVKAAGFDLSREFTATSVLIGLRFLQNLAVELERPMEDLTADDVILSIKKEQERNAA